MALTVCHRIALPEGDMTLQRLSHVFVIMKAPSAQQREGTLLSSESVNLAVKAHVPTSSSHKR